VHPNQETKLLGAERLSWPASHSAGWSRSSSYGTHTFITMFTRSRH